MSVIKQKCQVPTPRDIAIQMLDQIGYKENLYGKRVLENSCGTGCFLSEIVERYINDCMKQGKSNDEIRLGIQRDIHGFEKDRNLHKVCIQNLEGIAQKYGLSKVNWNVKRRNALHATKRGKYQFVVGNPPYLAYPELDDKTRKYLRAHFESCKKGKPDYYYAFIEVALNAMDEEGRLVYLVPGNFMKNLHSEALRQLLLPSLCEIFDYSHQKLFSKHLTSSVILLCDRHKQTNAVHYEDKHYNRMLNMPKTAMQGKWIFDEPNQYAENMIYFGDCFHASAPVATQLNEAFVLQEWDEEREGFIRCGTYAIENTIVRDGAGPKAMQQGREEKIIFPYTYDKQGILMRYEETQFKKHFSGAYKYLLQFQKALQKRKADKQATWFEYGRSQLLTHLNQEKLILSTFITEFPRVYLLPAETIPYAGICVIAGEGYTIEQAQTVLESVAFMDYVRKVGVCTNGVSYRISPRDINTFCFSRTLLEG